ncbi:nuclear speckle splicing regulatory protein 1 isoform X2 [Mycetomoellerius zeteki]|uniref:nuclear speckle splicing regulatory protein 1 isoform X2 n=1 Tax=Mycetomoellerius zeteki TaxID=64791 RepID=UPI00084E7F5F|nr:PREDICTED: nuclear speckle splicing regulatory protein 1 isoform X2 [Trachymyrmex zeteki]
MANKQYGLILSKKQQQSTTPKLGNVFGDDNASDEEDGTDWVRKALKAEGEKNRMKKQTKLDIQKALDEDPTIYQYDEVYDDLERSKGQLDDASKQKEKKSKYIQKLLKTAERRKKEQEHRIERMVQKEREAEGEMYADKESFVTSAYRAKLEEFKKMEEEEAKMNRLEAIGDVTKQQDMSGFYRHLYEQTVDYKDESSKAKESAEQREGKTSTSSTNGESTTTKKRANETEEKQKSITKTKKSRQYRQRAIETYESDSETETNKKELKKDETVVSPVYKEADRIEVQEPEEKKQRLDKKDVNTVENITNTKDKDENVKDTEIPQNNNVTPKSEEVENKEKYVEKKDRSSIWEKRTVGTVFEAALQRYYARKAKGLAEAN